MLLKLYLIYYIFKKNQVNNSKVFRVQFGMQSCAAMLCTYVPPLFLCLLRLQVKTLLMIIAAKNGMFNVGWRNALLHHSAAGLEPLFLVFFVPLR